ncbi:phospholipase A2 group XV-like isoform X2 [Patella vulgata]|uniref:phospholipase A2 group XV-like isoform X2 n=1 Tax=Patella vulgata TaxID=6465 RepID=UPI00217FC430|nr:phospholipase A2 group XV-like isoform X2 [Patella vulgata]
MYIKMIPALLLVAVMNPTDGATLNPVIIVPGDAGSRLDAVLNKTSVVHYLCRKESRLYNIWINLLELIPPVIDCFIDNLRLVYNNVTRTTSNSPGVDIYIPGFGDTNTVEYLDPSIQVLAAGYFAKIVNSLTEWGYVRGQSVRAAPYDFRKAPNEMGVYFIRLKNLIEDTYIMNNNTPVVLLAHSLGGCVSLYFLNNQSQSWKDKYISKYVTVSVPWGGTIKSLLLFTSGN